MKLPGQLEAEYALRGAWIAAAGLLAVALVTLAVVQTLRIDGYKLLWFESEGWKPKAERLQLTIEEIAEAQIEAGRITREQREQNEREYRDTSQRIDSEAGTQLDAAMSAADRYIADNSVWTEAYRSKPCPARTAAEGGSARSAEGAGEAPQLDGPGAARMASTRGMVVVSEGDIRICTENTIKAEAARDFALSVERLSSD